MEGSRTVWRLTATLFFFLISAVVRIPAITEFLQDQICKERYPDAERDSDVCNSASISSAASHWVLLLTVAQVTPSILVATAMGSFSDRYGRKTSLVLATASSVVESALLVAVEVMPLAPSTVRMALLGGEVVVGFMGAYSLFFMAVFSMVVDSIQRGQRTLLIGFMEGVIYLGMVVGYLAGGWVTRNYGYFAVFILMQSLSAISALLSVSVPETLPAARRQPAISWRQANIVAAAGVLARNANIAILAAIFVLQVATRLGIMGISVLYVRHMWNWRADLVSNYLAADSVAKGLALFATIPLAHRFLSRHSYWRQDITLIRVGLLACVLYYAILFGLQCEPAIWGVIAIGPIAGLPVPVLRAAISKYVSDSEQGKTMAALAAVESLAGLLAPIIFNLVYPATVNSMPSATYGVGCGMALLSVAATAFVKPPRELGQAELGQVQVVEDVYEDYAERKPLLLPPTKAATSNKLLGFS